MSFAELTQTSGTVSMIRLRPLTGRDELLIRAADPASTLLLLGSLVTDESGAPLDLGQLTVSQIDRLLAGLYDMLYGDRAECRVNCRECHEEYEFALVLSELKACLISAGSAPRCLQMSHPFPTPMRCWHGWWFPAIRRRTPTW